MDQSTLELLRGSARTVTSILITILFLVALLVSSAQQQAVMALQRNDVKLSYSVARNIVSEAGKSQALLDKAQGALNTLKNEKRALQRDIALLDGQVFDSQNDLEALVTDVRGHSTCPEVAVRPDVPAPTPAALWNALETCKRDHRLPDAAAAAFEALHGPGRDLPNLTQARDQKNADLKDNQAQIDEVTQDIAGHRTEIDNATKARESLQDVTVLDANRFVGANLFSWLPPAAMQILLCFVSGLFGALLITLILVVYPNNDFSFVGSNSYWSRILLGGLIAVGVFVVIGGGVAVVGSSQSLLDGSANYLSFCAIGLLAGMFSDRVARWLSARADAFIQENGQLGPKETAAKS